MRIPSADADFDKGDFDGSKSTGEQKRLAGHRFTVTLAHRFGLALQFKHRQAIRVHEIKGRFL